MPRRRLDRYKNPHCSPTLLHSVKHFGDPDHAMYKNALYMALMTYIEEEKKELEIAEMQVEKRKIQPRERRKEYNALQASWQTYRKRFHRTAMKDFRTIVEQRHEHFMLNDHNAIQAIHTFIDQEKHFHNSEHASLLISGVNHYIVPTTVDDLCDEFTSVLPEHVAQEIQEAFIVHNIAYDEEVMYSIDVGKKLQLTITILAHHDLALSIPINFASTNIEVAFRRAFCGDKEEHPSLWDCIVYYN